MWDATGNKYPQARLQIGLSPLALIKKRDYAAIIGRKCGSVLLHRHGSGLPPRAFIGPNPVLLVRRFAAQSGKLNPLSGPLSRWEALPIARCHPRRHADQRTENNRLRAGCTPGQHIFHLRRKNASKQQIVDISGAVPGAYGKISLGNPDDRRESKRVGGSVPRFLSAGITELELRWRSSSVGPKTARPGKRGASTFEMVFGHVLLRTQRRSPLLWRCAHGVPPVSGIRRGGRQKNYGHILVTWNGYRKRPEPELHRPHSQRARPGL